MGVLSETKARAMVLGALLLLATLGACGVDPPTEVAFAAQDVAGDSGDDVVRDAGGGDAVVLRTFDGTWLVWSQLSTCVALGTILEESVSRALFLVEADYDETTRFVDESWTACHMELPAVFGAQTFATPALYATAYPVHTTDGFVTGLQVGSGYVSGQMAEVWGFTTDDPHRDPLPSSAADPRISDTDGDGNPGVTVLVRGGGNCETYLVQRGLTTFQGIFVAPDRLEGTSVSHTRQYTVGASTPFCASLYESWSNDLRNNFTRLRVDGQGNSQNFDANGDGRVTCDEVTPLVDSLFTRMAPDDDNCLF
jgi:hypothetical protein